MQHNYYINSVADDCMCLCSAVIYEALMTVVNIYPDDALLSVASKCIGHFLSSKAANLQYIGNFFTVIITVTMLLLFIFAAWLQPSEAAKHDTVAGCLPC